MYINELDLSRSRGDTTPIELLLEGVGPYEPGIRRLLFEGTVLALARDESGQKHARLPGA